MAFGLKYVRVNHPKFGDVFFLFSRLVEHKDFIDEYLKIMRNTVISAGFSDLSHESGNLGVKCFGRSISLDTKSGDDDSEIVTKKYKEAGSLSYLVVDGFLCDVAVISVMQLDDLKVAVAGDMELLEYGMSKIILSEMENPVFEPNNDLVYKKLNYELYDTRDISFY